MSLFANTIEFGGRKAVINSYSHHPLLTADRERQLAEWQARFPNATVRTEELPEWRVIELVAHGKAQGDHLYNHAWDIGRASQA